MLFQQAHSGILAQGYDSFAYFFLAAAAVAAVAVAAAAACGRAAATGGRLAPAAAAAGVALPAGAPPSLAICIPLRERGRNSRHDTDCKVDVSLPIPLKMHLSGCCLVCLFVLLLTCNQELS